MKRNNAITSGEHIIKRLNGLAMSVRWLISWLLLRLPLGPLSRAEEERIERETNWGRW